MILYTCLVLTKGFTEQGHAASPAIGAAFYAHNAQEAVKEAICFMFHEGIPSHLLGVRVSYVQRKESSIITSSKKSKVREISDEKEVHVFFDMNEIKNMEEEIISMQKENKRYFATVCVHDPSYISIPIHAPSPDLAAKMLFSSYINVRPASNVQELHLQEDISKEKFVYPVHSSDPNQPSLVKLLETDMHPDKSA